MWFKSAALALAAALNAQELTPLTTQPAEKLVVDLGFRDWSPAVVGGGTVLAGNRNGRGGLHAIDAATGKLRWSLIPKFTRTPHLSTAPAVAGKLAIAAFPNGAVIAADIATGREVWRGPQPALNAAVATDGRAVFYGGDDGAIYALDAATGHQRWAVKFDPTLAPCYSQPLVSGSSVILTAIGPAHPKDPTKRGGYYLFAFDSATGAERWRFRAEAPYVHNGVCLSQPVIHGDTVVASGESRIYAVDLQTGLRRWPAVELKRTNAGRVEVLESSNVVAAKGLAIVLTPVSIVAVDANSGRIAWEIPGTYQPRAASLATAGNVLYFQGSPEGVPSDNSRGTLHALDIDTRRILWSYNRVTPDPHWRFGPVVAIPGGIWVDTYKALLKLQ